METILLGKARNVLGQPRLVTCRCVAVNNALIHRFVDERYGLAKQVAAGLRVRGSDRCTKLFDLSAELTAVRSVDVAAFFILSDPLFG